MTETDAENHELWRAGILPHGETHGSVQRLVRLLDAVRTAKPWLESFERTLASSLSSDSRSHDADRQPRRDINAVLNALADCDKPNAEVSRAGADANKTKQADPASAAPTC